MDIKFEDMIMRNKITSILLLLSIAFCFLTGCSIAVYDDTETTIASTAVTTAAQSTIETSADQENESSAADMETEETSDDDQIDVIDIDGVYTTCEDVALYIHTYDCLPSNFMTKDEARALGWEGGSLEPYAPGMCIGGDRFGNYEGLLPEEDGREYRECDINTLGASSRGAERLIYSNDGLIYYTEDHYESFTLVYGEP